MDNDALLVRYKVLAANRRHFESLFFGVIAFSCIFSLAFWAAMSSLRPTNTHVSLGTAGAILIGGAFIAYRLLLRERAAFSTMVDTWRAISGEPPQANTGPGKPGAMAIVVTAMAAAGCFCLMVGFLRL